MLGDGIRKSVQVGLDVQEAYDQACALEEAWGCFRRVLEEKGMVCVHPEGSVNSIEVGDVITEICGECDRVLSTVSSEEE